MTPRSKLAKRRAGGGKFDPIPLRGLPRTRVPTLPLKSARELRRSPGPAATQYKEYQRSAQSAGFVDLEPGDSRCSLLCVVNPSNPTGDYMSLQEMQGWIETTTRGRPEGESSGSHQGVIKTRGRPVQNGVHVLVDESMLM